MKFDVILCHAPSVYDFRNRDDILFAYLSNSDSVHVSPIFEMPPVGLLALNQHLIDSGYECDFFNIASRMLHDEEFDVEEFFSRAEADLIGFDLHWSVHSHGALELLKLYKEIHPGAKTILGGIASTYYHEELIGYPQVDYVMRGYDTLLPMEQLMKAGHDPALLSEVPNLTWNDGGVRINELSYAPNTYSACVDWSKIFAGDQESRTAYNLVIPQAGCEYNCRWCGGSRRFFKKYMGLDKKGRVQKTPEALGNELQTIVSGSTKGHTVTMIDFWHEYPALFDAAAEVFEDPAIRTVHYSLHRIPPVERGTKMAVPSNAVIELSPDSHELEVAKASGRGKYTMEQMEEFIDALIDEVHSFEIYFMLGMPKQTPESIWGTVDYCEHLLRKYEGKRVYPFICPMLPFLDPGSEIFEEPDAWGYSIIHSTVEELRQALVARSWGDRLNYETEWLSRKELVDMSYGAVRALTLLKAEYRKLPKAVARSLVELIDETQGLLSAIDAHEDMPEGRAKDIVGKDLATRILAYNKEQFNSIRSQQRPVDLGFAKAQWFDTDTAFKKVMEREAVV
jgi:clorobiocin/coumermycin A biosynthesis protein CloN6/CouN6